MAWLCDAGTTLRKQIDARWPERDKRSDGWIGDAAHTTGDHVPDMGSSPSGCVRAIDVDEDLLGPSGQAADPDAANRLVKELAACAREGRDGGRLKYIIFEGRIYSGTYRDQFWTPRPFSGDPHTTHIHISFTNRGDHRGGKFELPIFYAPKRRWLTRQIKKARAALRRYTARRKALPGSGKDN
jgi:hypothetical protein